MSGCDVSFGEFTPSTELSPEFTPSTEFSTEFTPCASSGVSSSSSWATLDSLEEQQAAPAPASASDYLEEQQQTDGEQTQADLYPGVVFCMPVLMPWGTSDGWMHQEPWALPLWGSEDAAAGAMVPAPGVWHQGVALEERAAGAEASEARGPRLLFGAPPPRRGRPRRDAAARPPARAGAASQAGSGQRAARSQAGGEPAEAADDSMPVRRTFIHFDTGDGKGPAEPAAGAELVAASSSVQRSSSAPPLLLRRAFCLRDPRRDEAHRMGDCKPCAYYLYKEDGCRWGDECSFCHLCVEGEVKKRKKEKHKIMKLQARCARRGRQCRRER